MNQDFQSSCNLKNPISALHTIEMFAHLQANIFKLFAQFKADFDRLNMEYILNEKFFHAMECCKPQML